MPERLCCIDLGALCTAPVHCTGALFFHGCEIFCQLTIIKNKQRRVINCTFQMQTQHLGPQGAKSTISPFLLVSHDQLIKSQI